MKYLSIDLEATGLRETDLIIEFAACGFSLENTEFQEDLKFHRYIKCPSFKELKPTLDPWVIENNESLIHKAHDSGQSLAQFKQELEEFLSSKPVIKFFENQKIIIFGKSLNAIDLPFLNRDLGWNFMRKYFNHQVLDLSSVVMSLTDFNFLPENCRSGSGLMKHFNLGEVAHTAMDDAVNTAKMYQLIYSSHFDRE